MAQSGTRFTGAVQIQTAANLDAFVASAEPGAEFTYCEAPEPVRGETWARVRELGQEGLVRSHQERRAGGGWRYYVVRTRRKIEAAADPVKAALADPATALILTEFKRAANFDKPAPSDEQLRLKAGLTSRDQANWRVRKLITLGLIRSEIVTERGAPRRVVTIVSSGKRTALPPLWAELERAASLSARPTQTNRGRG